MNHTTKTTRTLSMMTLLCMTLAACTPEEVDADAQDQPLDGLPDWAENLPSGKADNTSGLTAELGELGFGEDAALTHSFEGTARVHIYTMTLGQGDQVSFETTQKGSNRGIDTSLFLFAPQQDASAAVDVIASDGDSGWGKLSRIESFTAPQQGTYTLWVMKENTTSPNRYRVKADCLSSTCGASLPVLSTDECVFGPTFAHVLEGLGPVQVITRQRLGLLDDFDPLQTRQLVAAVHTTYDDVTTTAEAFDSVDQQEIYRLELWDASSRKSFIAFQFWAGDNPYGAIVNTEDDAVVALVQDGDIAGCTQPWGAEQQVCAQSSDCSAGMRCFGIHDGAGTCLDTSVMPPAGTGNSCTTHTDCAHPGLVCAGESVGAGFCVESWMRRSFEGVDPNQAVDIPDGSGPLTLETSVSGLATVSTDVYITLHIDHDAPQTLRVTLTNPLGTEVVVHDGSSQSSLYLDHVPVIGYPGDEDANGAWTLEVEDDTSGDRGTITHYTLEVTSRFD